MTIQVDRAQFLALVSAFREMQEVLEEAPLIQRDADTMLSALACEYLDWHVGARRTALAKAEAVVKQKEAQ